MGAQNEPKPKRKYVMTPERHAKLMANLGKARLAPKEKVYRKTPKRYAANVGNLAKANAKVRRESASVRAGLENLFPAPEVPPPPIVLPLGSPYLQPPAPPSGRPAGAEELDQTAPLIARRLRKVKAASRREGRRIMRVLTAAISRCQPLSANEAVDLARQLLQCLEGLRVMAEACRLNQRIEELLLKMIETRYGAEAQVEGFPLAMVLEQMREARRQRAARGGGESRAGQAAAGETASANQDGPAGTAEAAGEAGTVNSGGSAGQGKEPSNISIPALPKTLDEFRGLVARALDLEGEEAASVAGKLAEAIWERLGWWKRREQAEAQQVEQLFQEEAAAAPDSYEELRNRTYHINGILSLDDDFLFRMDEATGKVEEALKGWLLERPEIRFRRERSTLAAKPPVGRRVGATPDEPMSVSADPSAAA